MKEIRNWKENINELQVRSVQIKRTLKRAYTHVGHDERLFTCVIGISEEKRRKISGERWEKRTEVILENLMVRNG